MTFTFKTTQQMLEEEKQAADEAAGEEGQAEGGGEDPTRAMSSTMAFLQQPGRWHCTR